ncbi:hypothetical protein CH364_14890 [Leptospira harrisiae]|uniref:Uncharacterized protein n=1 Tax=Leptospira harrisiae TaxID=2023189 RepID=A0A2N0AGT7_9LEPT|nr:hypothetical protein CH364_14890 [Leptospira harrisiae]
MFERHDLGIVDEKSFSLQLIFLMVDFNRSHRSKRFEGNKEYRISSTPRITVIFSAVFEKKGKTIK